MFAYLVDDVQYIVSDMYRMDGWMDDGSGFV